MSRRQTILGHAAALFAALNWGFTFVLTDMLMKQGLTAYQALLLRSLVAYLFLWIICPRLPRLDFSGGLGGLA
ncbi:MAG: hypothetical protein FWH50_01955, partial [Coriobacteriia bacterium]|nr:hypothetical protein [Coriobacteriia bacterium]